MTIKGEEPDPKHILQKLVTAATTPEKFFMRGKEMLQVNPNSVLLHVTAYSLATPSRSLDRVVGNAFKAAAEFAPNHADALGKMHSQVETLLRERTEEAQYSQRNPR